MSKDKKEMEEERPLTESEIQEKRLRDAAKARKRRKAIKSLIIWLIIIVILAAVLIYFFVIRRAEKAREAELMNQNRTVETKVIENVYTQTIDISGYVEAYDTLQAKFRSTGAVTGVYVQEGDKVKKGDLLASIDDTSQRLQLQNIENQIEEAKLTGSLRQLELLEMQKTNAENNLDYTNIYANFDGIVADVNVVENDYFEAGSSVLTIIDRSKLKATVEIDEIDMQYVYVGQEALLTFDSLPGVVVPAVVSYIPMIGRYTNQGIGVVDVELTIENPPENLIPGFTFEGTITVQGEVSMLIIPSAAIKTGRGGVTTVKVKNDRGETEDRTVSVKYLGEGLAQVLSGLEKDETVVYEQSSGNMFMRMGMPGR